jgi:adenylate cyclase
LAAILHADVAGFSRLMASDEQGTLSVLKSRLDILGQNIDDNSGRICNTAGDAVLAEFPSVSAAVRCAVEAQKQIAGLNLSLPEDRRLAVRIGINLGEVMAEDDGQVYGTGVNVAARLQALAEPGGIAISGRAREQVDGAIPVGFVSMGHHRVKNIPNPVHVFRIAAEGPRAATDGSGRRRGPRAYVMVAAIAGLLVVVGGLAFSLHPWPGSLGSGGDRPVGVRVPETRLAVLPFRNASGDPDQDYVADAITEDLRSALGRFSEIGVIAGEALAGSDDARTTPNELRERFGVTYLLTGSIRRDDQTVRVTGNLVDTESGLQVWSQHYDRPLGELFDVEDEIVRSVAGEAMVTLNRVESERVLGKATSDLEAYDLYVRGRTLLARETRDDNIKARDLFRRAIERDPHYALAYIGLALTHWREASRGWSQFMSRNISETEELARHALQLEPNLPEGYEMLGWVSLSRGEYRQSEIELRKAVALNPNSLGTLQALGNTLTFLGDAEGAVQYMEKAVSLGARPSSRAAPVLALAYVLKNDPRKAMHFLETYTPQRRDDFFYATLAIVDAELDKTNEAEAAGKETLRAWPFFSAEEFARQFRDPDDQRRILHDLRTAGLR